MPSVKYSSQCCCLSAAVLSLGACSSIELARFAPPGFVKYEDIAGDQPPNPHIQKRIEERVVDNDDPFPVIAQTPAQGDIPKQRPAEALETQAQALADAGRTLQEEITKDQLAATADQTPVEMLSQEAEKLAEEIRRDHEAADQERAEPPPSIK